MMIRGRRDGGGGWKRARDGDGDWMNAERETIGQSSAAAHASLSYLVTCLEM